MSLLSIKAYSTTQINDVLIYNGKTYALSEYFLEDYFKKFPKRKPITEMSSSNLWRGYIAQFELKNNQLLLTDLKIKVLDKSTSEKFDTKFKSVFKEFKSKNPGFKLDWVNSLVLIPLGNANEYEPGFGLTFSNYELLEFKKGRITFNKKFDFKKYKLIIGKKIYAFLNQEELKVVKQKLVN